MNNHAIDIYNYVRAQYFDEDHGNAQNRYSVLLCKGQPSREVQQLLTHPVYSLGLTYINGSCMSSRDLARSAAADAKAVFVLCNKFASQENFDNEDSATILRALSIKRFVFEATGKDIPVYAQIIRPENKQLFVTTMMSHMRYAAVQLMAAAQLEQRQAAASTATNNDKAVAGSLRGVSSSSLYNLVSKFTPHTAAPVAPAAFSRSEPMEADSTILDLASDKATKMGRPPGGAILKSRDSDRQKQQQQPPSSRGPAALGKPSVLSVQLPSAAALADNVVCIQELKLNLLAKSCLVPGLITLVHNLVMSHNGSDDCGAEGWDSRKRDWLDEYSRGCEYEIYRVALPAAFVGITFTQAAQLVHDTYNILLFALEIQVPCMSSSLGPRIALNPGSYVLPGDPFRLHGFVIAADKRESELVSSMGTLNARTARANSSLTTTNTTTSTRVETRTVHSHKSRQSQEEGRGSHPSSISMVMGDVGRPTVTTTTRVEATIASMKAKTRARESATATTSDGSDSSIVVADGTVSIDSSVESSLRVMPMPAADHALPAAASNGLTIPIKLQQQQQQQQQQQRDGASGQGSRSGAVPDQLPPLPGSLTSLEAAFFGEKHEGGDARDAQKQDVKALKANDSATARDVTTSTDAIPPSSPGPASTTWRSRGSRADAAAPAPAAATAAAADIRHRRRIRRYDSTRVNPILPEGVRSHMGLVSDMSGGVEKAIFSGAIQRHVIVCTGDYSNLTSFIAPLRHAHLDFHVPIVLLHPIPPTMHQWSKTMMFSDVYYMQGSPFETNDFVRAGIMTASSVVLFSISTPHSTVHTGGGSELIDGSGGDAMYVCLYRLVRTLNRDVEIVCEIASTSNVQYLANSSSVGTTLMREAAYATPPFAAGHVFTPAMMDILLVQANFNHHLISILTHLISGGEAAVRHQAWMEVATRMGWGAALEGLQDSQMYLVDVPDEYVGSPFSDLADDMAEKKHTVCLGLRRAGRAAAGRPMKRDRAIGGGGAASGERALYERNEAHEGSVSSLPPSSRCCDPLFGIGGLDGAQGLQSSTRSSSSTSDDEESTDALQSLHVPRRPLRHRDHDRHDREVRSPRNDVNAHRSNNNCGGSDKKGGMRKNSISYFTNGRAHDATTFLQAEMMLQLDNDNIGCELDNDMP